MDGAELIANLIDFLEPRLSVPVQVAGTGGRPIPSVTIDDWNFSQKDHHNTPYAGSEFSNGEESVRYKRRYYTARLTLLVTHDRSLDAHQLAGSLHRKLMLLDDDRTLLHNDVNDVRVGDSSGVSHQFNVPTESQLTQTMEVDSFVEVTNSDFDVLKTVTENITYK